MKSDRRSCRCISHLRKMGRYTQVRLLSFNDVWPTADIAAAFGIAPDSRVQRPVRVRSVGALAFGIGASEVARAVSGCQGDAAETGYFLQPTILADVSNNTHRPRVCGWRLPSTPARVLGMPRNNVDMPLPLALDAFGPGSKICRDCHDAPLRPRPVRHFLY